MIRRRYNDSIVISKIYLEMAMEEFGIRARALSRILKISRTYAGLQGSDNIKQAYAAEAKHSKTFDRKLMV